MMLSFEAFSLLKHLAILRHVFSNYPSFLGHTLLIDIQEISFQGKIKTRVGNVRLAYK